MSLSCKTALWIIFLQCGLLCKVINGIKVYENAESTFFTFFKFLLQMSEKFLVGKYFYGWNVCQDYFFGGIKVEYFIIFNGVAEFFI